MLMSTGAVALIGATGFGIGASVSSTPSMMSRADYESTRTAISVEAAELQLACDGLRSAERHLCQAETRARESVLVADLEARYRGTVTAAREANFARIRAKYDVDRSRCFAYAGIKRDDCVIAAHAERARALMAIKAEG